MKSLLLLLPLLLLAACGGSSGVSKTGDVIQIRPVLDDDPLAAKFETTDGDEIRLGDPILSDQFINSLLVRESGAETFELSVYMTEFGAGRWRKIMKRTSLQLALVVQGRVRTVFAPSLPVNKTGTQILVPAVASTQEEADKLQTILDTKKSVR